MPSTSSLSQSTSDALQEQQEQQQADIGVSSSLSELMLQSSILEDVMQNFSLDAQQQQQQLVIDNEHGNDNNHDESSIHWNSFNPSLPENSNPQQYRRLEKMRYEPSSTLTKTKSSTTTTTTIHVDANCKPVHACQVCTTSQRHLQPQCHITGKIQQFSCPPGSKHADDDSGEESIIFQSCLRTPSDEEFLMVQFQLLCVCMGTVAIWTARKIKNQHRSLFDQRRSYNPTTNTNKNTHRKPGMIELTPNTMVALDSELEPLTNNDNEDDDSSTLDVV